MGGDFPPQGVGKGLKNIALGIVPTIYTAFDVNPTNLNLITNGNWDDHAGTGTSAARGAFGDYGQIQFDLGKIKTVLVSGKVGMWANTFDQTILIMRWSEDNVTFGRDGNNSAQAFANAETLVSLINNVVHARYINFELSSNVNNTPNVNFYEIQMYEIE